MPQYVKCVELQQYCEIIITLQQFHIKYGIHCVIILQYLTYAMAEWLIIWLMLVQHFDHSYMKACHDANNCFTFAVNISISHESHNKHRPAALLLTWFNFDPSMDW